MTRLSFVAIPSAVADHVRATGKSPGYGHPVHTEIATGYGPCRHCLRDFEVGRERRMLFTYDPFHRLELLPLPGPVFIHADGCSRYVEDSGFPDDLRSHELTLMAYGEGRRVVDELPVVDGRIRCSTGCSLHRRCATFMSETGAPAAMI